MDLINKDELALIHCYRENKKCIIYSSESIYKYPPTIDLSIIVPCYNVEKFINKCLDSIVNQKTNYKYEIIIVNDGSTDNTLELIKQYVTKYKNINLIDCKNKGVSAARNSALIESRGKYLIFIDSDDYISENYVDSMLTEIISKHASIVACSYSVFNTRRIVKTKKPKFDNDLSFINGCFWGKIFNRELFNYVLEPEGYLYEDTILNHIIFLISKKVSVTSKCTYFYRQNINGIVRSSNNSLRNIDSFLVTNEVFKVKKVMKIEDTNETFINVLKQFYLNEFRISKAPKDIRRLVFNAQSRYVKNMVYKDKLFLNGIMNNLYYLSLKKSWFAFSKFCVKLYKLSYFL